jgi:hypothetical protein
MANRAAVFWFISLFLSGSANAQWNPPDYLRNVPVRNDCEKTQGRIGIAFQPSLFIPHGIIFLCPDRAAAIDNRHPGASLFFRVHEYGHLALGSRDEAAADAWAAEELSRADGGRAVLSAVLRHFIDIGDRFSPYYGTGLYRALNIAQTARIDRKDWPAALLTYQEKWDAQLKRNGSIRFQTERQSFYDGLVVIDGNTLGFFDTRYSDRLVPLPALSEGTHRLSLVDVWMYRSGANNKLQAAARGMSTTASFTTGKAGDLTGYISETDAGISVQVKPLGP